MKLVTCPLQNVGPVRQTAKAETCFAQLSPEKQSQQVNDKQNCAVNEKWHPPVDLSHLEEEEQETVREMLYEKSDSFAKDVDDIGNI